MKNIENNFTCKISIFENQDKELAFISTQKKVKYQYIVRVVTNT